MTQRLNLIEMTRRHAHWTWTLHTDHGAKGLELIHGDLCDMQAESDVVVCSAFKDDHIPTRTSLIGALLMKRGINVELLSRSPELDFRSVGCWLSRDTGLAFRRIACVELLDGFESRMNGDQSINTLIKRSFSTLRFILEQADLAGIPVRTVTMPILGTGNQRIDLSYISAPLISQCCAILQTNPGVERIVICERTAEKAAALADIIHESLTEKPDRPQVFISYSSKQEAIAREIRDTIEAKHISYWMAPESIPAGSSYQERIPVALQEVDVVLLILTPDAEKSRWVQKEIGSAIGANKKLLPYQIKEFALNNEFRFLLDGEQIMRHEEPPAAAASAPSLAEKYARLVAQLRVLLKEQDSRKKA